MHLKGNKIKSERIAKKHYNGKCLHRVPIRNRGGVETRENHRNHEQVRYREHIERMAYTELISNHLELDKNVINRGKLFRLLGKLEGKLGLKTGMKVHI